MWAVLKIIVLAYNYLIIPISLMSRLLIVISFLFIIIDGEKLSLFMFIYLLAVPANVIAGTTNIFSLELHQLLVICIDVLFITTVYASLIYLGKNWKNFINTKSKLKGYIFSCIPLYLFAFYISYSSTKEVISIVFLIIFFSSSMIDNYITLRKFKSLQA